MAELHPYGDTYISDKPTKPFITVHCPLPMYPRIDWKHIVEKLALVHI
jgi:hypothetical protein